MNSIEQRKSIRNFQQKPLLEQDIQKITSYINDPQNLIGPNGYQIKLVLLIETVSNKKEQIGTYGFIKNAQAYLLGSCKQQTKAFFDFGYVFEGLILYLTSLEIGTCWLGGTFDRQGIAARVSLAEDDIIPAITPLGYAMNGLHLKERIIRQVINANHRKAEDQLFFFETFQQPLDHKAQTLRQALRYLRLSPSAKNNQPWRILVHDQGNLVSFYIHRMIAKSKSFSCPPEYLDIGIAYRHFKEGLDEIGIQGRLIQQEPDIAKPAGFEYITSWKMH